VQMKRRRVLTRHSGRLTAGSISTDGMSGDQLILHHYLPTNDRLPGARLLSGSAASFRWLNRMRAYRIRPLVNPDVSERSGDTDLNSVLTVWRRARYL
jgi:hypothetical protein